MRIFGSSGKHSMRAPVWPGSPDGVRPDVAVNVLWYRSHAARRFVFARFVPLLTAGSLIWETLHLPFYTLWQDGTPRSRAFAVAHCTIGDVMIGTAALLISVILLGRYGWPHLRHGSVLAASTLAGIAYTIFSEWKNTQVTLSWEYSNSMPLVPPLEIGVVPLLQWMIVPPLAYWLAHAVQAVPHETGKGAS